MGPSQLAEILRPLARLGELLGSLGRQRRERLFCGTMVDRMTPDDLREAASVADDAARSLRREADSLERRLVGSVGQCATSGRTG